MDRKKLKTILTDFLAGELDWSHVRTAMDVADILAPKVESLIAEETKVLRAVLSNLLEKLSEVKDAYAPLVVSAYIHGVHYKGPQIDKEIQAAKDVLEEAK